MGAAGRRTLRWAEDLDDLTRQSLDLTLTRCEHLVPSWCLAIEVRRASRDLEWLVEWGNIPLVALPDRSAGEVLLLVREHWSRADQPARDGALAYWFGLDAVADMLEASRSG